jgi:hypothetical protein
MDAPNETTGVVTGAVGVTDPDLGHFSYTPSTPGKGRSSSAHKTPPRATWFPLSLSSSTPPNSPCPPCRGHRQRCEPSPYVTLSEVKVVGFYERVDDEY